MLELAGREADGTVLWMVGPGPSARTSRRGSATPPRRPIGPRRASSRGSRLRDRRRRAPRAAFAAERLGDYGRLPAYRAMLDREGWRGPEDCSSRATSRRCATRLAAYAAAGATDLRAAPLCATPEETERTRALLASLAKGGR